MNKRFSIAIIAAALTLCAGAQTKGSKERTIALWGHVKNSVTRIGIKDAFITLMRDDSTVVDTMHVFQQYSQGKASISRSFPHPFGKRAAGSLVARLEGFDLLHQLSSTYLSINGQGRTETIRNTPPRHDKQHLTYNWQKVPKKR